jgi:hypothetical protein
MWPKQPIDNLLRGKLTAYPKNKDPIMLIVLELLVALVVGFVLGRIWEIRQEIRRDRCPRHVATR